MDNRDRINDGAVFPNDRRRSENSPNLTGNAQLKCPHCGAEGKWWLSAWTKVSKGGKKFLSLAFTPDDANPQQGQAPKNDPMDFDDDIPF